MGKRSGAKINKVENTLDERFQWREGLDPDHIYDEEREMICQLRERVPQLSSESDNFVATFLFSRRHNISATIEVLNTFYQKKALVQHLFPDQHVPSFKYSNLAELLSVGGVSMLQPRGHRDHQGRMIRYFIMERENTSARSLENTILAGIWQTYYLVATEPLNAWRCGTVMVLDMKNAGFRNIDLSPKGREILKSMQGIFPFRITEIILINGGMLISVMIAAAKLVLPRKFMDRLTVLKGLQQVIPPQSLLQHYGGTAPIWFDEFLNEIIATEDMLFANSIYNTGQA